VAREVRAIDGTWFLARVQPYRTVDNMIDGVVLTFTDITERILAIAERQARELTEGLVETVREPLVVLDGALRVVCASRSFYRNFHVAAQDTIGRFFYELGTREWDISALRVLLESILQRDQHFDEFAVEQNFPGVGWRKLLLNARRMVGKVGEPPLILLAIEEVDATPSSKKSSGLNRPT
jgi:two-component system CheB/CheR fusion protein